MISTTGSTNANAGVPLLMERSNGAEEATVQHAQQRRSAGDQSTAALKDPPQPLPPPPTAKMTKPRTNAFRGSSLVPKTRTAASPSRVVVLAKKKISTSKSRNNETGRTARSWSNASLALKQSNMRSKSGSFGLPPPPLVLPLPYGMSTSAQPPIADKDSKKASKTKKASPPQPPVSVVGPPAPTQHSLPIAQQNSVAPLPSRPLIVGKNHHSKESAPLTKKGMVARQIATKTGAKQAPTPPPPPSLTLNDTKASVPLQPPRPQPVHDMNRRFTAASVAKDVHGPTTHVIEMNAPTIPPPPALPKEDTFVAAFIRVTQRAPSTQRDFKTLGMVYCQELTSKALASGKADEWISPTSRVQAYVKKTPLRTPSANDSRQDRFVAIEVPDHISSDNSPQNPESNMKQWDELSRLETTQDAILWSPSPFLAQVEQTQKVNDRQSAKQPEQSANTATQSRGQFEQAHLQVQNEVDIQGIKQQDSATNTVTSFQVRSEQPHLQVHNEADGQGTEQDESPASKPIPEYDIFSGISTSLPEETQHHPSETLPKRRVRFSDVLSSLREEKKRIRANMQLWKLTITKEEKEALKLEYAAIKQQISLIEKASQGARQQSELAFVDGNLLRSFDAAGHRRHSRTHAGPAEDKENALFQSVP